MSLLVRPMTFHLIIALMALWYFLIPQFLSAGSEPSKLPDDGNPPVEKQVVHQPEPEPKAELTNKQSSAFLTPFRITVILAITFGAGAVLVILLAIQEGRRFLKKLLYLIRSLLGVEVGLRGVIQMVLYSALPAIAVAITQGNRESKTGFDWHNFWMVFLLVTAVGVVANILNKSMTFQRVLSPGAGRVWRPERKSATAAIIQSINRHITAGQPTTEDVNRILRDLLDVIVLHVRDHRGNYRKDRPEVFGNLLLEDGSDLVVVARDSLAHSAEYQRLMHVRYPKSTMLCGRAIERRKVLSVGVLTDAYPEGPKNKPYQSILAIPLFSAQGDAPYGVLSIDCSRPYFFESFVPGQVENDLENSLQPYAHLITLALETLISPKPSVIVEKLARAPVSVASGGQL